MKAFWSGVLVTLTVMGVAIYSYDLSRGHEIDPSPDSIDHPQGSADTDEAVGIQRESTLSVLDRALVENSPDARLPEEIPAPLPDVLKLPTVLERYGTPEMVEVFHASRGVAARIEARAAEAGREMSDPTRATFERARGIAKKIEAQDFFYAGPPEACPAYSNTDQVTHCSITRGGMMMVFRFARSEYPALFDLESGPDRIREYRTEHSVENYPVRNSTDLTGR